MSLRDDALAQNKTVAPAALTFDRTLLVTVSR